MEVRRPLPQRGEDVVEVEPAEADRVGDLVEDDDVVGAGVELLLAELPATLRQRPVVLEVLRGPGEAGAHRDQLDAHLLRRPLFAEVRRLRLHEGEHADAHAAAPGARDQAEGGRGLPLAVAGVEQDEGRMFLRGHAAMVAGQRECDSISRMTPRPERRGCVRESGWLTFRGAVRCWPQALLPWVDNEMEYPMTNLPRPDDERFWPRKGFVCPPYPYGEYEPRARRRPAGALRLDRDRPRRRP